MVLSIGVPMAGVLMAFLLGGRQGERIALAILPAGFAIAVAILLAVAQSDSPLVYALIVPLVFLDLCVTLFQAICFPVYGIPRVTRSEFIVIDRHHLAYLNGIEKLNCAYCGYANGLLAYTRAIAGRAEEHWCPIKHARRTKGQHRQYFRFADYGDAEKYRQLTQSDSKSPEQEE